MRKRRFPTVTNPLYLRPVRLALEALGAMCLAGVVAFVGLPWITAFYLIPKAIGLKFPEHCRNRYHLFACDLVTAALVSQLGLVPCLVSLGNVAVSFALWKTSEGAQKL